MSTTKDVWVYANKWLLLDPTGKPIATVPRDSNEGGGHGRVGAKMILATKTWEPIDGPVKCKATQMHRMCCVRGELFPATAGDARILNVPFVDPLLQLAEAKAKAIVQYDAQFGAGAWAVENEEAVILPAPEPPKEPTHTLVEADKFQPVKPVKAERKS